MYIYNKKKERIPSIPSSVLAQQSNHRVPDLGPIVKLVGTMTHDSVRKREKKCIKEKREKQIHMLLKEIRSSLET